MSILEKLEPKLVWKHFDEIRKIPHCSKHEEKIRNYVVDFAKKHNLPVKTDPTGNVVVKKPASKNMEKKPIVILQGHLDMVCEKNSDITHDFEKDPLQLKLDGDLLSAQGTTLGADNGIGVATILAILEDTTLTHGPLEALFTIDEETGLTGAFAMKSDMLTGRIMLNLDSEEFGIITVGCAGGGDSKIQLPLKAISIPADLEYLLVKIHGLRGGHSGVNIHEQRGNAIKILGRLLWKAAQTYEIHLREIKGGDKHNAIPREAYAKLAIHRKDKHQFISFLRAETKDIYEEIKPIDPDVRLDVEDSEKFDMALNKESQHNLFNLLLGLPHGVQKMSYDIPDLVETSTNLATISFKENYALIGMSSRSPVKSELQALREQIQAIATLSGATVTQDTPYPGWKPNLESKLLEIGKKVYKQQTKKDPLVKAVHAGLECGIIGEKFPGMDMISIGPTIKYLHSPDENVSVHSVQQFYTYVQGILQHI